MILLRARNINEAYPKGIDLLKRGGVRVETRNGPAYRMHEPVTTHYERPCERVLFDPTRDANPFFHLMEALWILAGRQDVDWLAQFNARIADYSDDGVTFHAAYGHRLRRHFGFDQLNEAVEMLRADPASRRVVLTIWDAYHDLGYESNDIPCNDMVKLEIQNGKLNAIVFNRSNDAVWGAYGANVVQFSVLQEYLAARIGVDVGFLEQVSTDLHLYDAFLVRPLVSARTDPYDSNTVRPLPMVTAPDEFDGDLAAWFEDADAKVSNDWLTKTATPMARAYAHFKTKQYDDARWHAGSVHAPDWQLAALQWLDRRAQQRRRTA